MVHRFRTSLSIEEFKDIFQSRAHAKGIEIAFNRNKLIIKNCVMNVRSIDYHVPFIAKMSTENNKTVINGHLMLPKFHYITMLVVYLVSVCINIATIENATEIYRSLIFLFVLALCLVGMSKFVLYSANINFPSHNKEVVELLNSIVNDFPAEH